MSDQYHALWWTGHAYHVPGIMSGTPSRLRILCNQNFQVFIRFWSNMWILADFATVWVGEKNEVSKKKVCFPKVKCISSTVPKYEPLTPSELGDIVIPAKISFFREKNLFSWTVWFLSLSQRHLGAEFVKSALKSAPTEQYNIIVMILSECFIIQIIFSKKMDTTNWYVEFCHVCLDLDELCAGAVTLIKLSLSF